MTASHSRILQIDHQPKGPLLAGLDYGILGIYVLLVAIGWLNIFSSEWTEAQGYTIDFAKSHGKQIIWIGAAMVLITFVLLLDARVYHTLAYPIYGGVLLLLVATIFLGKEVNGARGWLVLGSFQFQTAELGKFATALALGRYLSTYGFDIKNFRQRIVAFVLIGVPMLVIIAQNDTGTALVLPALIFVLYRQGLSILYILVPLWAAVVSVLVLMVGKEPVLALIAGLFAVGWLIMRAQRKIVLVLLGIAVLSGGIVYSVDYGVNTVLQPHQRQRIDVLLGKIEDAKDAGYNVLQSLIAIGSGGLTGKGYLQGTQTKYNFVPEQSTDFIFCTVGEEWGFAGTTTVVLLYLLLFHRLIILAERQRFLLNRCYAYGVLSILLMHFAINISMTLGLFPVIGIPLPFISYGGSSLISFTLLLFVALKLDADART